MDSVANIILYFVVAICMTVFSVMAVTSRRILRAATYLLFVLISTSVIYFQLGYEFLGAVQIAVYAGAPLESHRRALGISISVAGCVLLLLALFYMPLLNGVSLIEAINSGNRITMHDIGVAFTGTSRFQYLLPFEAVSVLLLACIIGGVVVARKR